MSEWDAGGGFESEAGQKQSVNHRVSGEKLHIGLTISCLISVTAISFLIAWLMKDRVRTFWEMGLVFALPFAVLMGITFLVEKVTQKMTPIISRGPQLIFSSVTVVVAFVFGCLMEILHQPVIIEHVEPQYDYLLLVDKSGSMVFQDIEDDCQAGLKALLNEMEEENRVGIIAFDDVIRGQVDIEPLDEAQKTKIRGIIEITILIRDLGGGYITGPGTNFSAIMNAAMQMFEKKTDRSRTVRMILVTDGDNTTVGDFDTFEAWAQKLNSSGEKQVELCAVQLGESPMLDMVKHAVRVTGGTIYDRVETSELARQLQSLKSTVVIPERVDTLKATYKGMTADGQPNTPYMILTAVMLLLLGALCGFALMMMYSVNGQFRFQVILSPLMGICAFLLLNFGRHLGIAPAWICEGIAFSLFGIVFMRENQSGGAGKRVPKQTKANAAPAADIGFDDF